MNGNPSRSEWTSDSMMNTHPVINPPFGLDVEINIKEVGQKTFKQLKMEDEKIVGSLIPPRLPLETNLHLRYRTQSRSDFVKMPFEVKKTSVQIKNSQVTCLKRLSIPRTQTADSTTSGTKSEKIEFYSASDARRDAEQRANQLKKYQEFVMARTSSVGNKNKTKSMDTSWY